MFFHILIVCMNSISIIPDFWKGLVSLIAFMLMSSFRNPLIAYFAFRVNRLNRQINEIEERERKRVIEIQDAQRAREERKNARRSASDEHFDCRTLKPQFQKIQMDERLNSIKFLSPFECHTGE